ncbi:MAG: SprB repeat-containing protein, partial [Bacteroidota bacterium]
MKNVFLILTIILFGSNTFAQNCQNDTIPPAVECVFSFATDTCGSGAVSIAAKEFIVFSRDNCTDSTDLNFSFTIDPIDTIATFESSVDSVSVWVTDAAGNQSLCNSSLSILNDSCLCDPNLEITGIVTPACQGNDGSILLDEIESDNPPFAYAWNTGFTERNPSRLSAGEYIVTVIDNFGCFYIKEFTVPTALQLETSSTPSCDQDGTASVSVSGGTPPYEYIWNTGEEGENIGDLSEGRYEVTVTDAEGCFTSTSVEITSAIEINVTVTYDCEGKGSIEISARDGETPLSYLWSNGASSSSISDLEIGIYTVTITDENGCARVEQVEVEEYETLEIVSLDAFDNCDNTGNIFPEVIGGQKPYTYSWVIQGTQIITVDSIFNAPEGFYIFTVHDANGCTATSSIELKLSPTFEVEIEVTADCEDNTFGVVASIKGDENNEGAPFFYEWSYGASSPVAYDLFSGFYLLTVSNNYGCILIKRVEITENYITEFCNQRTLNGTIFLDQNSNCRYD